MSVDGEDVEYFGEDDWQRYRKEKVAVIHQDFQLIENISVRKNIEVAYTLNHSVDNKNKRNEINEILRRTGLSSQAKQSVATLSGGQKQRVAIARALAKDTPIILADELTGNLDKAASAEIAALLGEISKDKLLVVVTHNAEQFESDATRCIVMDSGAIVSDIIADRKCQPAKDTTFATMPDKDSSRKLTATKALLKATFFADKKIGTFFSITVFVVMVITMLLGSVILQFSTPYYEGVMNTPIFGAVERDRLILKNDDGSAFSEAQIDSLKTDPLITYVVENDIVLDIMFEIEFGQSYGVVRNQYYANTVESPKVKGAGLSWGRLPESDNEVLLSSDNGQAVEESLREVLITAVHAPQKSKKVKIVGGFVDTSKHQQTIYFTKKAARQVSNEFADRYSEFVLTVTQTQKRITGKFTALLDDAVESGVVYLTPDLAHGLGLSVIGGNAQEIKIENKNLYYTKGADWADVKVIPSDGLFLGHNISASDSIILMNPSDYVQIVSDEIYQISVYMKNPREYANIINAMEAHGFLAYYPYAVNLTGIDANAVLSQMLIFVVCLLIGIALIALSLLTLRKQSRGNLRANAIILSLGYDRKSIIFADAIKNIFRVLAGTALCIALVVSMGLLKSGNPEKYENTFVPLANLPSWFIAIAAVFVGVIYIAYFILKNRALGKKDTIAQTLKKGGAGV
jgi:ABC-type lipoprotein export system ATPase subunit